MRTYNEKMSIYHGMAATISLNLSNNFFPIFAITILGATNIQVGLLSSLPPLMALLMTIPAAVILNKASEQKRIVSLSILLARLMFLFIILVVYMPDASLKANMFLVIVAIMSIPNTVATIGWQTFISGLVSEENRGQFFSDRNRVIAIVGLISTLIVGLVMRDATGQTAYQFLFGIALLFGVMEVVILMKHEEPASAQKESTMKRKMMDWSIFSHSNFVWFLIAALFFNFAWQMAWGLFNIYHVRIVGATIFWISMFSVGSMVAQFLSFPLWKKWADKKSNIFIFTIAAIGMATTPFLTVLSSHVFYILIIQTSSGFFLAGVVLLLFNLLLEQSPKEVRTYCITTYNVLLSAVAFTAPQFGIYLLEKTNMDTAMNIASGLRFLSAALFFFVSLKYAKVKVVG